MAFKPHGRKILMFGDDPSIRNLLQVLMEKLEQENTVTTNRRLALATINRSEFDAVLLDLRCSNPRPDDGAWGIGEIWPNLVGRVLAITAEVSDLKTLELIEQHLRLRPFQNGVFHDLSSRLRVLFHLVPTANRV